MTARGVVALDIGGTHVSAATIALDTSRVVPSSRMRVDLSHRSGRGELLRRIRVAAGAARSGDVVAAGVAVPGPFDYSRGICLLEHKLASLYGADLRSELATALALGPETVRFMNDAEAFLLGEWWAGAARGHDRAVGITIGTGLGSAFLERGRIVRGGVGVPPEGALYRLLFHGVPVEERISRSAVLARYGGEDVDVAEIAARAREGERRAHDAFAQLACDLAEFLRPWLTAFAPSCLVVGGSIARSWDLLDGGLDSLASEVAVVTRAEQIDDAPLLGAALNALAEDPA